MSMNSTLGVAAPTSQNPGKPPGYLLLLHVMNEGNFFKTVSLLPSLRSAASRRGLVFSFLQVMEVAENCVSYLDRFYVDRAAEGPLLEAGFLALRLIQHALSLQVACWSCQLLKVRLCVLLVWECAVDQVVSFCHQSSSNDFQGFCQV